MVFPIDTDNKEHLTFVNYAGKEGQHQGLLYRRRKGQQRPNRAPELMTAIMELSTATNNTLKTFKQLRSGVPCPDFHTPTNLHCAETSCPCYYFARCILGREVKSDGRL